MSKKFGNSARFYDLIYKDKDYAAETHFVCDRINRFATDVKTLLEVGCGTGNYAYRFRDAGLKVHGIDASSEMISIAVDKKSSLGGENITFEVSNAEEFSTSTSWDAAVSLFFMLGYQVSDEDLHKTFNSIRTAIRPGGLFAFDFWHGPSVLEKGCYPKKIEIEMQNHFLVRESIPEKCSGQNCFRIQQSFQVEEKDGGKKQYFEEVHKVRYFFREELQEVIQTNGFELLGMEAFMGGDLEATNWAGIAFARAR